MCDVTYVVCDIIICDMTTPFDESCRIQHRWHHTCNGYKWRVTSTCHLHYMWHHYMWHDSFTYITCDKTHSPTSYVTWLIDTCIITCLYQHAYAYVWYDVFIHKPQMAWLFDMCDMTHWYVWHDSLICVTWLIHLHHVWNDYIVRGSWMSTRSMIWFVDEH